MSTMIDTSRLSPELYDRCAAAVVRHHDAGDDDPITAAVVELEAEADEAGWSTEALLMLGLTVRTVGDEVLLGLALDAMVQPVTVVPAGTVIR